MEKGLDGLATIIQNVAMNIVLSLGSRNKRENYSRSYFTKDAIKRGKSVSGSSFGFEDFFDSKRRPFRLLLHYDKYICSIHLHG